MHVQRTVSSCFAALRQRQPRQIRRWGTCSYVPNAGSCLVALPLGLRQRCAGRYPSVFIASTPVGFERGGTDDFSLRRSDQPRFVCKLLLNVLFILCIMHMPFFLLNEHDHDDDRDNITDVLISLRWQRVRGT